MPSVIKSPKSVIWKIYNIMSKFYPTCPTKQKELTLAEKVNITKEYEREKTGKSQRLLGELFGVSKIQIHQTQGRVHDSF